ncbi:hypothetical protein [Corynebacterium sp. HMSC055A01]|uniref:hypothetical protein n=1 Tax=Corynebacterium sp. HMSC055A01 TaxID=1715083 RepID=UPI001FEE23EE|nr:hypothetical protein [Corynebacterium sp. HMSC055A01]
MALDVSLRYSVVRIRRERVGTVDELGNDVVEDVEAAEPVLVAGWAVPQSDEPKLAGHERRTVKIEMYAPTGAFLVGDAVRLPERGDVLEVVGEPENYEHNPFGWSPGLEVVNLAGIE